MQRRILIVVFALFALQGVYVMSQIGYWAIWTYALGHLGGQQALADLVIALSLVSAWMWQDAKNTGRRFWPWMLATAFVGSFSPLLYLITAGERSAPAATPASESAR